MKNTFSTTAMIKDFLTTKKPEFNLINTLTKNSVGYKLKFSKVFDNNTKVSWTVYAGTFKLFIGYMHFIPQTTQFSFVGLGDSEEGKLPREGFRRLMIWLNTDRLPTNVVVQHNGVCGICGKELSDPESIIVGIGPTCRKYLKIDIVRRYKKL